MCNEYLLDQVVLRDIRSPLSLYSTVDDFILLVDRKMKAACAWLNEYAATAQAGLKRVQ